MEINNFDKLVNAVAANIIQKIDSNPNVKLKAKSCLVLIPNLCLGIGDYITKAYDFNPGYDLYFAYDEKNIDLKHMRNANFLKYDLSNKEFIRILDEVEKVTVIGLKIKEMKELSVLDDTESINHVIITRLMADKNVEIMINHENLVFNRISDTLTKIRQLGIGILSIKENKNKEKTKSDLITENYVIGLKKNGVKKLVLSKDQLVTPLAKDKLREYKMIVEYDKEDK